MATKFTLVFRPSAKEDDHSIWRLGDRWLLCDRSGSSPEWSHDGPLFVDPGRRTTIEGDGNARVPVLTQHEVPYWVLTTQRTLARLIAEGCTDINLGAPKETPHEEAQRAALYRDALINEVPATERFAVYGEILANLLAAAQEGEINRVTLRRALEAAAIKWIKTPRKDCVKCEDPIRDPQLIESEPERCACCSDDQDDLDVIKQEAYVEGFNAARKED